jgi:beta-phosphoglucomutase-like phosphatase (HAD superfamily)
MIVNKLALAAALALAFSGAVHAADIAFEPGAQPAPALTPAGRAGLALAPHAAIVIESRLSELPEPEVFAMMLVGLVLIGYRASRDSDEKFK